MKRLCFGTLFKILYQARIGKKADNERILSAIFSAYKLDRGDCGSETNHLKNGHDNVPQILINAADDLSFEEVNVGFQEKVVPLIKDDKKEFISKAIKMVLRDDNSIDEYEIIGYASGYEKINIINKSTFDFSNLLVSVFYYSIKEVNQTECKDAIKEIDAVFFEAVNDSTERVYFETSSNNNIQLNKTINASGFSGVFKEVYSSSMVNEIRSSTIHIFSVDIANDKFRFMNMNQFIINNIGNYVMSREKISSTNEQNNLMALGTQALRKYIQSCGKSKETILGETLLYVFLEQVLNAPKIMSKIELDELQGSPRSDGIYLLHSNNRGIPFNKLVFGVSHIIGNLKNAVDSVFNKISNIDANNQEEYYMVNSVLDKNILDYDTSVAIKEILFPTKDNTNPTEISFGCFLGYSLSRDKYEKDKGTFLEFVKRQMQEDISEIKSYVESLITANHLEGYNFYFYVLPFNDADEEKISIVKDITGGN